MQGQRPPLNGATLVMALPMFRGTKEIDHYYFVAKLPDRDHDEFVVSTVDRLDSPTWGQGYYFTGPDALKEAVSFAYVRSGAQYMPWTQIAEEVTGK